MITDEMLNLICPACNRTSRASAREAADLECAHCGAGPVLAECEARTFWVLPTLPDYLARKAKLDAAEAKGEAKSLDLLRDALKARSQCFHGELAKERGKEGSRDL